MIILGIDPGIARCGWGVIESKSGTMTRKDHGCIETGKELIAGERLEAIHKGISKIVTKYKPDVSVVERLFFAKNAKTAMAVAETRGVIILALRQKKVILEELTPYQIKSAATGYGNADKMQVQKMVKLILKLKEIPKPDDAADGLAAAIAGTQLIKLK